MGSRLELQTMLEGLLGSDAVYYQPPTSVKMKYPAIVYTRRQIDNTFADNSVYRQGLSYTVTVIDKNPDSSIVTSVSQLPMCRYDRGFKSDNLNHDVFVIYY